MPCQHCKDSLPLCNIEVHIHVLGVAAWVIIQGWKIFLLHCLPPNWANVVKAKFIWWSTFAQCTSDEAPESSALLGNFDINRRSPSHINEIVTACQFIPSFSHTGCSYTIIASWGKISQLYNEYNVKMHTCIFPLTAQVTGKNSEAVGNQTPCLCLKSPELYHCTNALIIMYGMILRAHVF